MVETLDPMSRGLLRARGTATHSLQAEVETLDPMSRGLLPYLHILRQVTSVLVRLVETLDPMSRGLLPSRRRHDCHVEFKE